MYLLKSSGVKDWAGFAEVYWMPLRIGKYEPGATMAADIHEALVVDMGQIASPEHLSERIKIPMVVVTNIPSSLSHCVSKAKNR